MRGWDGDVPGDVAPIGMDHSPLSAVTVPKLLTIEYDLNEAARTAADRLLEVPGAVVPYRSPPPNALKLIEGRSA